MIEVYSFVCVYSSDNQSSDHKVTHLLGRLKGKANKLREIAGGYLNKAASMLLRPFVMQLYQFPITLSLAILWPLFYNHGQLLFHSSPFFSSPSF